jgi:DMSO/TMAO reductase YedYZ heme-binding membrane subunit
VLGNSRFYILVLTAVVAGGVYVGSVGNVVKLTQIYALLAVTYLWLALMATPITRYFPTLPGKGKYIHARRAIGVSAWIFAVLHWYWAFFGELGGLSGLLLLALPARGAIAAGSIALCIMTAMAATSTDWAIEKMGFERWKKLHKLVYLAGILVVVHAMMLGSHFSQLNTLIPMVIVGAGGVLGILEATRLGKFMTEKITGWPTWVSILGVWGLMASVTLTNWGIVEAVVYQAGLGWLAGHCYRKIV